jgi:endoglycosylceramidase
MPVLRPLVSLVLSLAALSVGSGAARAAPADPAPTLARESGASRAVPHGDWILDPAGRVLVLHGLNMVYKRPPYAPDVEGFGRDDARFLARNGFTTVRLGLIWKAVEPQPGQYDDAYLDRIRKTAEILADEGIWTLLDFHQDLYHERFQGEGAPDWAVLDDGLPAEPQLGFPNNYFAMPGLNRAFDNFWDNADGPGGVGLQDRYAAAWAHVADRFRATPRILGVDLFNEPWPGDGWELCANPLGCPLFDAKLEAFTQRSIDAIRDVDDRTAVFYEPQVLFNNGAQTSVDPSGRRLGFSFHDYCLTADIGIGEQGGADPACGTFDDLVWSNTADHVASTGHPALLTEFGATKKQATLRDMVRRAEAAMTGWQYWAYCGCDDPTTTGPGSTQALVLDPARSPGGDNVDWAKMRALVVPHPLAVAGTPASYTFDRGSRVFRATWSTARAGGQGRFAPGSRTTISVPRFVYGGGYVVRVAGARVVSRANDGTLVLAQAAGATRVRLVVRPR